ncbi:MAG: hypothetical protein N3C60_08685 [Calditerrivibrio sp.]|nr:hypothetical protein [Calditerrivibrio sp.]
MIKSGWTLIELVIIILLVGILAVVVGPKLTISDFKEEAELTSLVANIRYAQHKSMVVGGGWSIEFFSNQYLIKDEDNKTVQLPGGENPVKVTSNLSSSANKVFFDFLGRPDQDNNSNNNNLFTTPITITFGSTTRKINPQGGIE